MNKFVKVIGGVLSTFALAGGLYINSQREALIQDAVTKAEEKASAIIGTEVKIGSVDVDELNFSELLGSSITIRNIEIFDKNSEHIATADEAKVTFKLLSLYDEMAGAIDEIDISGAKVNLKKRGDDSWNVNDIKLKSEGESNFDAKITVADSSIDAEFDGKKISVTEIAANADCADLNAIDLNVDAKVLGSHVNAAGIVGADNQAIQARVDAVNIAKVLPYIPEGTLPDSLTIHGGTLDSPKIYVTRRGELLTYLATGDVRNGAVRLEDTEIANINGNVVLNEREVRFNATATANGQSATANGKVRTNADEPFFDIYAESDSFAPSAIMGNIGVGGAASFTAHVTGTAKSPQVEADIFSPYVTYENISAGNVSAHVNYFDNRVYLTDVSGETFGGKINGEVEVHTPTLQYNAHVKANGIDAAQILNFAGSDADFNGKISADVDLNGEGADTSKLKIFGSAETYRADYQGFNVDNAKLSFYYDAKVLKIDNLNAILPNHGAVGVEGTVANGTALDLKFYASHVDLNSLKHFNEQIDVSGWADLLGEVHGNISNPQVALKLSAVDGSKRGGEYFKGTLFKQSYDSIKLDAAGSLDEITINEFRLEKDGKIIWQTRAGTVGLTGDKRINLELDTKDARLENIVALVAPDQKITGNLTNTLKITGTLDNPNVVGNANLHYGSYNGILITGMEGDYFFEGDKLRLQNFYVTSPMIDAVLDGTFDKATGALDFVVEGKDISLKRFQNQFPEGYVAEGHGTFEGVLKGTVDAPHFIGKFISPELIFNGIDLTNVNGKIEMTDSQIVLDDFKFNQGDGFFNMDFHINRIAKTINGEMDLQNADIPALLKLANKDLPITGKLNSNVKFSGTRGNLYAQLTGNISKGAIGDYDIHDVELEITHSNDILHFNKFNGKQGDTGTFNLHGKIDQSDVIDVDFDAKNLSLGMFAAGARLDLNVTGTTDINAKIGGTVNDPTGEGTLTATGSVNGAAFDLLKAHVLFKDWTFDIQELFVQRQIANNIYKASAKGTIPVQALYIDPGENAKQMNLKIGLDDADLTLLPVFDKYVDWATGGLNGNLTITGTLARPKIDGIFAVDDGTVKLKFMSTPIEELNISTQFKDDRFDIKNFTGNVGKGKFNLTGGFNFANFALNGYNFNLKMDALDIRSSFFNGPLNAEFTVSEVQGFRGNYLPKLEGHIDLDKCTVSVPTIPDSDDPLPNILLDVSINLGDKFRFYSSHLYDMYLIGSAHFEGTTLHPKTSGTISVKRGGTLTYANSVFDIREGEAHFNQIDSFFPSIHFAADTKFSRTTVFLTLNGSLNNMDLKLTSTPAMSQTEIVNLLTLRENYAEGKGNITASDILAIGLQMSLLADVEDTVRKTLGVDQFRLTRGNGSAFTFKEEEDNRKQNEFNVFIGKYISDKIMLRYTQGITGDKITRFGFQYDINNNIGITVERERGNYIFGLEARYNF